MKLPRIDGAQVIPLRERYGYCDHRNVCSGMRVLANKPCYLLVDGQRLCQTCARSEVRKTARMVVR